MKLDRKDISRVREFFDREVDRASRRIVVGEAPVSDDLSRYNAYLASLVERDGRRDVTGTTTRGPLDE